MRKIGQFSLPIWLVMSACALAVLISGNITLKQAFNAINFATIFYLLAVFFIGSALHDSKLLEILLFNYLSHQISQQKLLFVLCFSSGLLSALLLNDTIAIIGIGTVISLIRRFNLTPQPYLYTLAFSMTIGSAFSPVGNPQNLLIAQYLDSPFISFFTHLIIPSLISLYACYKIITFIYHKQLQNPIAIEKSAIETPKFETRKIVPIYLAMTIFISLIILKILFAVLDLHFFLSLSMIALLACLPILLFYPRRFRVIKGVDWYSLLFFIAMFIFMHAVWLTGITQAFLDIHQHWLIHPLSLVIIGFVLSQILSNVPAVMLLLPVLNQYNSHSTELLIALSIGSTLAGNLSMLGAASNVIIFQYAEKMKIFAFRFCSFFLIGSLLSLIFLLCYFLLATVLH